MPIFRYVVRLMAILVTLLLVSCIDGREEYWLNTDGSGQADLTYSLPAAAANFQGGTEGVRKMLDDFLQRTPQLKNPDFQVKALDGRMTVHLRAAFDSVIELGKISKTRSQNKLPASVTGLTGTIALNVKGLTAEFSRIIDPGKALPGSFFMPSSQFENRHLTYIAHLPTVATEFNASSIQDGGKTLVWDFPLSEAIRQPFTIHFKAPVPIPTWLLVSAGVILLLVILLIAKVFRRLFPTRRNSGLTCLI